jgi:hypothetical protein
MLQKPQTVVKYTALGSIDFRTPEEEESSPDGSITAGAAVEGIDVEGINVGFIFSTGAAVDSRVGADGGVTPPPQ